METGVLPERRSFYSTRLLDACIYDGPAMRTLAYLAFFLMGFHLKIKPIPVNLQ